MRWNVESAKKLAHGLLDGTARVHHVESVARTLAELVEDSADADALVASAWLHDIGYAPQLHRTGMHSIDGALFLDLSGAPQKWVSLVAFHTGAEFEAEERELTDQLAQFDPPQQELLDALTFADLITGADGERVSVPERLEGILERYEPQHPVHRAVTRSRPYLEECARRAAVTAAAYPM